MPYNLDIPGWMPEAELRILERLARRIPEGGAMLEGAVLRALLLVLGEDGRAERFGDLRRYLGPG